MPQPSQHPAAKGGAQPGPVSTQGPGLTGVFKRLVEQHKQIAALLRRAEAAQTAAERQAIWSDTRRQLLSHDRAEVLEVYAALEGFDATRAIVERHSLQAEELESAVNEVDAVDYDSERWLPRLCDVVALVEDHVQDEETDFFPRAQKVLGEQESLELDERFMGAQREVLDTLI
jgi:hypothetical protein